MSESAEFSEVQFMSRDQFNNLATKNRGSLYAVESAVVIESYKNGTTWYRKWSDGWIEQGMQVDITSQGQTFTLPVPMLDTNYMCSACSFKAGSNHHISVFAWTATTISLSSADDETFNSGTARIKISGYYAV